MNLSETEIKILLKFWDVCTISLYDSNKVSHFYCLTSKQYLWNTIKLMERKGIITSFVEGRIKYIKLTSKGRVITNALHRIKEC